jgi:hypothetical protein
METSPIDMTYVPIRTLLNRKRTVGNGVRMFWLTTNSGLYSLQPTGENKR